MEAESKLNATLAAERIQVVPRPKVAGVEWEAFRDEFGGAAIAVRLVLESNGREDAELIGGARTIWEALLEGVLEEAGGPFPYVRFQCRRAGSPEVEDG